MPLCLGIWFHFRLELKQVSNDSHFLLVVHQLISDVEYIAS